MKWSIPCFWGVNMIDAYPMICVFSLLEATENAYQYQLNDGIIGTHSSFIKGQTHQVTKTCYLDFFLFNKKKKKLNKKTTKYSVMNVYTATTRLKHFFTTLYSPHLSQEM